MSKIPKMVWALIACNVALGIIGVCLLSLAFEFAKTQGWLH